MKIKKLLEPRAVAIVGASARKEKVGNIIARNMLSFKGKLFFVNPNPRISLRRVFSLKSGVP